MIGLFVRGIVGVKQLLNTVGHAHPHQELALREQRRHARAFALS
jgi:hypothetical protein